MKVYHLVVQRKAKYSSVPEFFESCDEYTMDENPAWMQGKIEEVIANLGTEDSTDKEFVSYGVVAVEVPDDLIDSALKNWIV